MKKRGIDHRQDASGSSKANRVDRVFIPNPGTITPRPSRESASQIASELLATTRAPTNESVDSELSLRLAFGGEVLGLLSVLHQPPCEQHDLLANSLICHVLVSTRFSSPIQRRWARPQHTDSRRRAARQNYVRLVPTV